MQYFTGIIATAPSSTTILSEEMKSWCIWIRPKLDGFYLLFYLVLW